MDLELVEPLDDQAPVEHNIASVLRFPSPECALAMYERDEWHNLRLDFEAMNSKLGFFLNFWRGKKLNGKQQKQYESMQATTQKAHLRMVQYREEFIAKFAASDTRVTERKRLREEHEGEDPLGSGTDLERTLYDRSKMIEKAIKEKAEAAFDASLKEAMKAREDMSQDAVTARAVKAFQEKLVEEMPEIDQID